MDSDRFIPMDELPFLKKIARQIYLNSIRSPYDYTPAERNMYYFGKYYEARRPKRVEDILNELGIKQKEPFKKDFSFNLPHMNILNMFNTSAVRSPQINSGTSSL